MACRSLLLLLFVDLFLDQVEMIHRVPDLEAAAAASVLYKDARAAAAAATSPGPL